MLSNLCPSRSTLKLIKVGTDNVSKPAQRMLRCYAFHSATKEGSEVVAPRKTGEAVAAAAQSAASSEFLIKLPNLGASADPVSPPEHQTRSTEAAQASMDAAEVHPAFAKLSSSQNETATRTSDVTPAPKTQHYVDQAHPSVLGNSTRSSEVDEEYQYSTMRAGTRSSRIDAPRTMSGDLHAPSQGWFGWISNLNEAIAPFAGLIVTVALLSCVGLLFWIITDHPSSELDLEQLGISEDGLSVEVLDIDNAEALPADSSPLVSTPREQSATAGSQSIPSSGDAAPGLTTPTESDAQGPHLEAQKAAPQEKQQSVPVELAQTKQEPLGYLEYPRTSTPDKLAFERAIASPDDSPANLPRALPEIAERENPAHNSLSR